MPSATDFTTYRKTLQASLELGNATEHTHRPALQTLLESGSAVTAVNEPKHIECGAPDFVVTLAGDNPLIVGYVEAKNTGVSLADIDRESARARPDTDNGRQFKRYRNALPNLILTNYTEFRWYVDGQLHRAASLDDPNGVADVGLLLDGFLSRKPQSVANSEELALRMARLTHLIRDVVAAAFEKGEVSANVRDLYNASREALVPDLVTDAFADMFAQTFAYGLFAARVNHAGQTGVGDFRRNDAIQLIPDANPFISQVFGMMAGPGLGAEPFVAFVDDLTQLLAAADMAAVFANFGSRAARQDPIMHFYETFLAAYDPNLREGRGVYYTPEPVISYIVRSVDQLLKERFGCADGLADNGMTEYEYLDGSSQPITGKSHRVLVLDPACGTGSFLYAVTDHIREYFKNSGNAGMWSGYVTEHLLPRLFGFELLMAPYAMAHLKLGMQLAAQDLPSEQQATWAYQFGTDERLGVYLTNSLEQAEEQTKTMFGPLRAITDEANAAAEIKRDLPIMVVIGNPPYSGHSANKGQWIASLIDSYKEGFPELRRPAQAKWLSDDYVKFIRFAQWRIDQSGSGVLGFVTNHSYLDNPTFRGMRRSLMATFDEIHLLDLHGNANKRERTPDGGVDQNVFDIRQGVAIGLFVKHPNSGKGPARVFHADLWGKREDDSGNGKYEWLASNSIETTDWDELSPDAPLYLFVPRNDELLDEYSAGWSIPEIFSPNGTPAPGIVTTHDQFAISWDAQEAASKVEQLVATSSESEARLRWRLCSQSQWQYDRAKAELANGIWRDQIKPILYRPFDVRTTVFNSNVAVHRRDRVMRHMLAGENIGLITCRQLSQAGTVWAHCGVTTTVMESCAISNKTKEINYVFPLYVYPTEQEIASGLYAVGDREPNLTSGFTDDIAQRTGLAFIPDGPGNLRETFGPEDVFRYIYAVFHSPAYRERYNQFLRVDFPRVPSPGSVGLFRELADLGSRLVETHLLRSEGVSATPVGFPVPGDNVVAAGYPKYAPGDVDDDGRVYINTSQYFAGVAPAVWEFRIGGYQPMDKWLKDRRRRALSTYPDVEHYGRMAAAIAQTIAQISEIDGVIENAGGLFG